LFENVIPSTEMPLIECIGPGTYKIVDGWGRLLPFVALLQVLAYCNMRNEIRSFALDCINEFKITNTPYVIPKDFNMDDYFKPSWHIMRYGKPIEVSLRFSKDVARWIKRRKWHPDQIIKERKDGSIIFKVKLQGTKELKWWTYHWAPYCEILSPPELRKEAKEEIRKLGRVYAN